MVLYDVVTVIGSLVPITSMNSKCSKCSKASSLSRPLSSASASPGGPGPPPTTGPHRDTGTGGSSTPHFPTVPSLAADDATMPVASAVTILAASPSLDATVDTAAGATATATSTAGVGMEVDTDPVPITTAPPTAGRISSFLSYIRRSIADDATATAASATETLATPPLPDVHVDANEGATASAASAAAASLGSSGISVFSPPAPGDATRPTASAAATLADPPSLVVAVGTAGGATATHTTTDVHPTDDTADDDAADAHAFAVDASARVSPLAAQATPVSWSPRSRPTPATSAGTYANGRHHRWHCCRHARLRCGCWCSGQLPAQAAPTSWSRRSRQTPAALSRRVRHDHHPPGTSEDVDIL